MAKQRKQEDVDEFGFIDIGGMVERETKLRYYESQIELAEITKNSKLKSAESVRIAKAEGSQARARKTDEVIIAVLAELAGYLNGTDDENARALIEAAEANGLPLELGGNPIEPRTVRARLITARHIISKQN